MAHSFALSYDVPNTPKGLFHVGEFGNKFRTAREKKELSFDDIAGITKISPRMLQAIEEEHFDQLPGGVFNRGFIRAYAKHLGLDAEEAVNDYLSCLRQEQIDSHNGWDRPAPRDPHEPAAVKPGAPRAFKPLEKPPSPVQVEELPDLQLPRIEHVRPPKKEYLGRPTSGIPWLAAAALLCVVIAAVFLWMRHSRTTRAERPAATPASVPALQPSTTPAVGTPPQAIQTSKSTSALPAPAPALSAPATVAAATSQPADLAPTTSAPAHLPPPAAAAVNSTDPNAVQVEKKGDVTIRSFGGGTAKPAERAVTKLTLVIRATENSWISVTSDGQPVTQETLIAPAATTYHATRELVVRVGNAAGVSFSWNGEELPPQGAEAEAKTLIFDSQGMHPAISPDPSPQN